MKRNKRLISFLLAAAICLLPGTVVRAEPDPIMPDQTGSITVTMTDTESKEIVPGGVLRYYLAARPEEGETFQTWIYTEEFAALGLTSEEIGTAETAARLASYAEDQELYGQDIEISSDGCAVIPDLPLGLYLMVQISAADGYQPAEPFLVTVPCVVNGTYQYNVDATPKVALNPATSTVPGTTPPPTLPQTGQLWWPSALLGALGILLLLRGARKRLK